MNTTDIQDKESLPNTTGKAENNTSKLEKDGIKTNFQNLEETDNSQNSRSSGKRKKPMKVAYNDTNLDNSKKNKWDPDNWEVILNNIREMRKSMDAPVDTMGCDVSHDLNLTPEVCQIYC